MNTVINIDDLDFKVWICFIQSCMNVKFFDFKIKENNFKLVELFRKIKNEWIKIETECFELYKIIYHMNDEKISPVLFYKYEKIMDQISDIQKIEPPLSKEDMVFLNQCQTDAENECQNKMTLFVG